MTEKIIIELAVAIGYALDAIKDTDKDDKHHHLKKSQACLDRVLELVEESKAKFPTVDKTTDTNETE